MSEDDSSYPDVGILETIFKNRPNPHPTLKVPKEHYEELQKLNQELSEFKNTIEDIDTKLVLQEFNNNLIDFQAALERFNVQED